jgi:hypothetical protein
MALPKVGGCLSCPVSMSQPQAVEAARVRIQRLVDEIAALSKSDLRSEEYYQQFLTRAVAACDGRGGAVWIVGNRTPEGKSEFQLAAAVELESSLFQSDEQQRTLLLRSLAEVVQSKKPFVLPAEASGAKPGSVQAQLQQMAQPAAAAANKTPYPYINVPLFLKEQVLGVLQVWLQPYVTRDNYAEFVTFLGQLATHAEQHFQSRRMGNMVLENQRLQALLKFVTDMTGSLEVTEVGRLVVNYGRDLLACDRVALLRYRGGRWEALSISGQEVVEKKSTLVKSVTAFARAHTPVEPMSFIPDGATAPELKPWIATLEKKELLELTENAATTSDERALVLRPHGPTDIVDAAFFEVSQAESLLLVQVLDGDKKVVGALLAESSAVGFFKPPAGAKDAPSHRLAEWVATNTGKALRSAMDYQELPLLFATRRLREVKRGVTGSHRGRYLAKLIFWLALLLGILFFPWMEEVESDCTLVPKQRVKVVPEVSGRVETVLAREGQKLEVGQPIAKLETSALESELAHTREEMAAAVAEVRKYSGLNDPANEQIALTKVRSAEEKIKRLDRDIAAATLRSPIAGVLLTKDIELLRGVYLNAGADFAVVGQTDQWDLLVHINEKEIGKVERLYREKGPVDVRFILYTHNQNELLGKFKDRSQLSQIAYPHERENALKENAFILTLPNIEAPDNIRRSFRPDLTGRSSIQLGRRPVIFIWGRNIAQWVRLKWVW